MTGLAGPVLPWPGPVAADALSALFPGPLWTLRGTHMETRDALLAEWAAGVGFPPHFGGTWDAFRDALADLPEGGTFLILDADRLLQEAPPSAGATWLAVLGMVAEELAPRPFRVLLHAGPDKLPELEAGLRAMGW
ncbi:MAG: barstar family protein [Holophagaceae bacterium]